MSVSTRSILRVYRNRKNHPHVEFIGSAIYLGEGYAITCFHVIEPEAYEKTEPTLEQALRDYCYRLLTENGSKFADVEGVHGDRGPHKGDYALLKLKLTSDPSAHCVPIKLLGEVPATFLEPSASSDKLHWDDCDRIENCGYPGATEGKKPDIEPLRLKETIRKPGDASGLLADWQLLGGVRHGLSGGAILAHAGEQQVCLGMSYLGGEPGASSRITVSNQIIEFLKQDLDELGCPADAYQKFVLTADDFLKSIDRQTRSECVTQLREAWERDFCESPQGVDDSRTPFIESQGLSILPVMSDPWPQLDPKYFRSRRTGMPMPAPDAGDGVVVWTPIDRDDLVTGKLDDWTQSTDAPPRVVLTTDAGIGKTTNVRWLANRWNADDESTVAVLIDSDAWTRIRSESDWLGRLTTAALVSPRNADSCVDPRLHTRCRRYLSRMRELGKLIVLIDGLDHADTVKIGLIGDLIRDRKWDRCRIVMAGRPHALRRHPQKLFSGLQMSRWRFVQASEFGEDEQDRYLGRLPDGTSFFKKIKKSSPEVLSILGVPRVLEYLKKLKGDADIDSLKNASDIYWRAIRHLISEGIAGLDRDAYPFCNGLPDPDRIDYAIRWFAAIAFTMTAGSANDFEDAATNQPPRRQPNFDSIATIEDFDEFKQFLWARLYPGREYDSLDTTFLNELNALAAMNTAIANGFFDNEAHDGLRGVLWRNRSLQEFFAAVWMSRHFRLGDLDWYSDAEGSLLRSWVYTPDEIESEAYYEIWRFAAEMPTQGRIGGNQDSWINALGVLYLPGDGTMATRRSNEMIYRSWETMTEYSKRNRRARSILTGFQSEFEEIKSGKRGTDLQQRNAQEFVDSFIKLDGNPAFRMGSPDYKQGRIDPEYRKEWEKWLADGKDLDDTERTQYVNDRIDEKFPLPSGKHDQAIRKDYFAYFIQAIQLQDLGEWFKLRSGGNETPCIAIQSVGRFSLSNSPVLNRWYRLYDPGHGLRETEFKQRYSDISGETNSPVIYVSWFDAWVFSRWTMFDDASCMLPTEIEWEYAAKGGMPWFWDYWWDDCVYLVDKCNGGHQHGKAMPPNTTRKNPFGLVDMLGNVWEWCEDWYEDCFGAGLSNKTSRVLRGGSWHNIPLHCRSAYRFNYKPAAKSQYVGFRVARGQQRKS